jgi:hypothetical protein
MGMPTEARGFRITEERGYARVKFFGTRTLPAILSLLEEVKAHGERTGVRHYLFDLNDSEEGFNLLDKYKLGEFLAGRFGNGYSLAVVMPRDQITGFLETVYSNRFAKGFRVFDAEPAALEWLKS